MTYNYYDFEEKNALEIIPSMYKIPISKETEDKENGEIESFASQEDSIVSSSYYKIQNLRVENQYTSGWCWAYASLKSFETYLMKHDNIGDNSNYNFAEYHLAYMKYNSFNSDTGWKSNEGYSNADIYTRGGNFDDFMKYLGILSKGIESQDIVGNYKILGPISGSDEDNRSYDSIKCEQFENKSPEYRIKKVVQFSSIKKEYDDGKLVKVIDSEGKDINEDLIKKFRDSVKEQIVYNSAVFAYTNNSSDYFNRENGALYINDNSAKINHAVTIVGWDDNYSKDNFLGNACHDGAWIAINSWGEESQDSDDGYIYISYDDALVEQYMYGILEAERYEQEDSIKLEYSTKKINDGSVVVTISSDQKLLAPDNSWQVSYTDKEMTDYYAIYETKTVLTKTYDKNTNETVEIRNVSGNLSKIDIEVTGIVSEKISVGDVNGDGSVNITDLLLLKRHLISGNNEMWKLRENRLKRADLNEDGNIDIVDILALKRIINKL